MKKKIESAIVPDKKNYHHGDLRAALIQSALKIISKEGIQELSLRKVAKLAGVSHAAPYAHFTDKETLLAAVAEEGYLLFADSLRAGMATEKKPWDQLVACGVAYVDFAHSHSDYFSLMFGEQITSYEKFPSLKAAGDSAYAVLTEAVLAGQNAKVILPGPPDFYAVACWSIVHGLALICAQQPTLTGPEKDSRAHLARQIIELLGTGMRAIKTKPV